MDVGDRIKNRRKQLSISAETLAEKIGVSPATIYRYESADIINMRTDKLKPIAKALCTTPAYLMGWTDDPMSSDMISESDSPISNLIPINSVLAHRIPILGTIACGTPILAEQNLDGYVDSPEKADFALRVKGNSMVPTYLDGDLVYIHIQPTVDDGQVAAVVIDGEATLKHVYSDKDCITLVADNKDYPPMHIDPSDHEDIRIAGLAVGFTRMYGRGKSIDIHKGMK